MTTCPNTVQRVSDYEAPPNLKKLPFAKWASRIVGWTVLILIWEFSSGTLVNSYYFGKPSGILELVLEWSSTGYLWENLYATLYTTIFAFIIASVSGVLFALLVASNPILDRIFSPYILAAFSLPKITLAPALVVWLGIGFLPQLTLGVLTSFFMVFYNSYSGLRNVNPALLNTVAIIGAGRWETAFKVRLPAAAPFLAEGLRQGLIYAFHGTVVGEMTASNLGIGYVLIF